MIFGSISGMSLGEYPAGRVLFQWLLSLALGCLLWSFYIDRRIPVVGPECNSQVLDICPHVYCSVRSLVDYGVVG